MHEKHRKHLLSVFNILVILTTFFTTSSAQNHFFKYYSDSTGLRWPLVAPATNNQFLVVHGKAGFNGGNQVPFMCLKVDENGIPIWDRVISNVFRPDKIEKHSDNLYYGLGQGPAYGHGLAFTFDSTGNILWSRDFYNDSTHYLDFQKLIRHDDSTFYLLYKVDHGLFSNNDVTGLAKLSSTGTPLWSNVYEINAVSSFSISAYPIDMKIMDDGSAVIIMNGQYGVESYIYMIKTDSLGSVSWVNKIFYPNQPDTSIYAVNLVESKNNKIVLVAKHTFSISNTYHIVLMQFDPFDGNLEWGSQYSANTGNNGSLNGFGAIPCEDGGYAIWGKPNANQGQNQEIFVLKVDSLGSLEWSYEYGGLSSVFLYGNLIETNDRGFALAGGLIAGYHGMGIFLLRTDSLGNAPCSMTPLPITYYPGFTPVSDTTSVMAYHCDLFSDPYSPFINTLDSVIERDYCVGLGLIESDVELKMELFPNPAVDHVTIRLNSNSLYSGYAEVKMSSIHGNLIFNQPLINNLTNINCTGFAPGLYVIQIVTVDEVLTEKVLIVDR